MNQLELILENIKLRHMESLLQEAQTEYELHRGIHLINENFNSLCDNFRSLLQENKEEESFIEKHRGKIAAGVGTAAGVGGVALAGRGYLGVEPQDWVHDNIYSGLSGLRHDRNYNQSFNDANSIGQVLNRPDNLLNPVNIDNKIEYQKYTNPEFYKAHGADAINNTVENIAGLDNGEKFNYFLRHPIDYAGQQYNNIKDSLRGTIDGTLN